MEIKEEILPLKVGYKEIIIIVLYLLALAGLLKRFRTIRYITLTGGLVFLGVYLNSSISIANLGAVILGYIPSVKTNLFWWLLIPGTLLLTLSLGKNIYCYYLCPFGAVQECIAKISGINIPLHKRVWKILAYLKYILTWLALMLIFLSLNPGPWAYEPFGTLYGFEGIGAQWFLLPAVLFGAFTMSRFWCRFFCPVGVILEITVKIHSQARSLLKRIKK